MKNGTYSLNVSTWKNLEQRIVIFDYVVIGRGYKSVVSYLTSASNYDPRLFITPFAVEVWLLIGVTALLVIICKFFGDRFARQISGDNQSRLLSAKWMISIELIA